MFSADRSEEDEECVYNIEIHKCTRMGNHFTAMYHFYMVFVVYIQHLFISTHSLYKMYRYMFHSTMSSYPKHANMN